VNFLAHALLTHRANSEVQFGNFIADAVKGNPYGKYTTDVVLGIRIHRLIDHTSDHHASYHALREMLPTELKRFSAILGDMYFDHLLATDWDNWHDADLPTFTRNYHVLLDNYLSKMPEKAACFYPFMRNRQWLLGYQKTEGTARAIEGMAIRRPLLSNMKTGGQWLIDNKDRLNGLVEPLMMDVARAIRINHGEEIGFSFFKA
jgi:acyl carrier protein phosphodiesterase